MEEYKKVFYSDIPRGIKPLQNNLYDLISVVPAVPIIEKKGKERQCDFQPRTDKRYVPKRKARFSKVKTVRDIRYLFESDIIVDLPKDLEKQQNLLLKKITAGSAREENTKMLAKNMIKCDRPISRTAWQMLMNLNPDSHSHAIQYILWNGRRIRINGSKGGRNKFLSNYDLAKIKKPKIKISKKTTGVKKKSLLQNSLIIKFKPGPLTRKRSLDDSYQKYNLGNTELVSLPAPGLDIRPTYGVPLEPSVANLVQHLRHNDGTISDKWAEYAVSVLGNIRNSEMIQNDGSCGVTFELNYKCNQYQILMRKDPDSVSHTRFCDSTQFYLKPDETDSAQEIKKVIDDMIDCVEISLEQDSLFSEENESERECPVNTNSITSTHNIPKLKRKYNELDRLAVTVIRLPEDDVPITCTNAHCSLGCICGSLNCSYNLKQHCGRLECMFECKCDFSKYKATDSFENDCPEFIPGLINLDNELNLRLAKEEQKFHQTVVVTGDKSILLKSERRNCKASKRYAEFYDRDAGLRKDYKTLRKLSISCLKLNLENVEPWCMVHNLYKCFCKGIFTQNITSDKNSIDTNKTIVHDEELLAKENTSDVIDSNINKSQCRSERNNIEKKIKTNSIYVDDASTDDSFTYRARRFTDRNTFENKFELDIFPETSIRTQPYAGRKYKDSYYKSTHKKIIEMEQNDNHLRRKMMSIINKSDISDTFISQDSKEDSNSSLLQDSESKSCNGSHEKLTKKISSSNCIFEDTSKETINVPKNLQSELTQTDNRWALNTIISNKARLVAWLEVSYKQYKLREAKGLANKGLLPPTQGKLLLYSWDFILSRYRERKNLFLVSKETPYRIFMAVGTKDPFFENCINIDRIRYADLHKYPVTIKYLLTNATDLKDNFSILSGLSQCWEVIGPVTKLHTEKKPQLLIETDDNNTNQSEESQTSEFDFNLPRTPTQSPTGVLLWPATKNFLNTPTKDVTIQMLPNEDTIQQADSTQKASSKWYVMIVENDFNEIQFFNRGFFVKYNSIIKAINVARLSKKTVRLSSQKCVDQSMDPQFGIYAVPCTSEHCVFIGPYEKDEPLGIETMKTFLHLKNKTRTRGIWITTKKVDNMKVIDNPLSFMPSQYSRLNETVPLDSDTSNVSQNVESKPNTTSTTAKLSVKESIPKSPEKEQMKTKKPIKIRKTNGFYHFSPVNPQIANQSISNSLLQPILLKNLVVETPQSKKSPSKLSIPKLPAPRLPLPKLRSIIKPTCTVVSNDSNSQNLKPVAEIAPQIKIVSVCGSEPADSSKRKAENRKIESGMLILKPEEINKRLLNNIIISDVNDTHNSNPAEEDETDRDIENFLATALVCNDDVFVISDGEDCEGDTSKNRDRCKNVWIECQNNDHLGWIPGRKNNFGKISFEFPGFKYTDFYDEEEAFCKINQVLSRKIYVPKNINLEWRAVETADNLRIPYKLSTENLSPSFVLTKRGLRHKRDLIASTKLRTSSSAATSPKFTLDDVDKAVDMLTDYEDQSMNLAAEADKLISEMARRNKVFHTLLQSSGKQSDIMETVQDNVPETSISTAMSIDDFNDG